MAVENFTYGSEADIPICCRDQYREGLGQPVVFLGEGLEKRETEQNFCNSYYPFGLRHDNSWERTGRENRNKFNAGSEQNEVTGNYEMYFRAYDPAIGRMTGIDPYAELFRGLNPYNYAANDPLYFNDPSGGITLAIDPSENNEFNNSVWSSAYGNIASATGGGGGGGGAPWLGSGGLDWVAASRSVLGNAAMMGVGQFQKHYGLENATDGEKADFAINNGLTDSNLKDPKNSKILKSVGFEFHDGATGNRYHSFYFSV